MSQKLKIALRTLLIISIVSVLAFLGLTVGVVAASSGDQFGEGLKALGYMCLGGYTYPFDNASEPSVAFAAIYSALGVEPLVFSIMVLAVSGLAVILLALGIAIACSRRKPGYLGYIPMLLVLVVVGVLELAYGPWLFVFVNNYAAGSPDIPFTLALLAMLALFFGALAFVLILVTYFIGLVGIAKKETVGDNTQTQFIDFNNQPVLPEENPQPEEVEEASEETATTYADDYIPTVEPEPEPDPVDEEGAQAIPVEPEPIPEPNNEETNNHVEVNVNNTAPNGQQAFDPNSLAALLRDVVRDIVRDEIARNNVNQPKINETDKAGNQTVTGATFGGPLVVQYFNGGINGVTPAQPPVVEEKKEEPKPAPAPVEEKKEESAPAPVAEEKKEEPAPAPAPAPEVVETPAEQKPEKVYERLTFAERLLQSDKELLDLYNELKNEILSYGVKSRISAVGDTFRLHKKMYVRITVAGKSLKLYFALNPDDYKDSKMPVQNAGHKGMYAEIPLVFKVRSGLSVRRCKELIQDCMDKDGLEQGEIGKVNWAKELKAELASGKKKDKDEDED